MSVHWIFLWLAALIEVQGALHREALEDLLVAQEGIFEFVGIPKCSIDDDCSSMAVGAKGCGGPSFYIVFARDTVDLDELERRVRENTSQESWYNQRFQVPSNCSIVMQPQVACDDGVCVARRKGSGPVPRGD